jgi:nucleotide-binding universal stress UspA family protein
MEATGSGGRVVVGVDGSEEGRAALRWAIRAAGRSGALLEVVHSWRASEFELAHLSGINPAIDYEGIGGRMVADELAQALAAEPDCGGIETLVTLSGDAPKRLLCQRSEGADLVVVGARGRGAFDGMLSGSVSQYVTVHAHCPVLVVR